MHLIQPNPITPTGIDPDPLLPPTYGVTRILTNWRTFVEHADLQRPQPKPTPNPAAARHNVTATSTATVTNTTNESTPTNPKPLSAAAIRANDRAYYLAQSAYINAMYDHGIEVPPVILVCHLAGRDILTLEDAVKGGA